MEVQINYRFKRLMKQLMIVLLTISVGFSTGYGIMRYYFVKYPVSVNDEAKYDATSVFGNQERLGRPSITEILYDIPIIKKAYWTVKNMYEYNYLIVSSSLMKYEKVNNTERVLNVNTERYSSVLYEVNSEESLKDLIMNRATTVIQELPRINDEVELDKAKSLLSDFTDMEIINKLEIVDASSDMKVQLIDMKYDDIFRTCLVTYLVVDNLKGTSEIRVSKLDFDESGNLINIQ